MDLGNVGGERVLGTLEVLYAGPIAFLIRRAAHGNEFLKLLGGTQYFAQEWIPLHTFMPPSTSPKQFMSAARISAFLDNPFNVCEDESGAGPLGAGGRLGAGRAEGVEGTAGPGTTGQR